MASQGAYTAAPPGGEGSSHKMDASVNNNNNNNNQDMMNSNSSGSNSSSKTYNGDGMSDVYSQHPTSPGPNSNAMPASSSSQTSRLSWFTPGPDRRSIGDYVIGPVLGIGTYGEVRTGAHCKTNAKVALKVVDLNRFRAEVANFMMKEIMILKKLNHPNCIKIVEVIYDVPFRGTFCKECACTNLDIHVSSSAPGVGDRCKNCQHSASGHTQQEERKVLLIVQELAAGGEVFGLLMHGGALPEPVARYYFRQLLEGLRHCHANGVIHRDLKPENLVLDADFVLKIVDFGLAAAVPTEGPNVLPGGDAVLHSGVGSKPYSAPEVSYTREMYNATGYKGRPADVWSCAVVLFVMITGRPPFVRPLHRTFNKDLVRCKHFCRVLKGEGYEGVPPQCKDLLMKLFHLNPDERLNTDQILQHPWVTAPVPSQQELITFMDKLARQMWMSAHRPEMVDLLADHRNMRMAQQQQQQQLQLQQQQQMDRSTQMQLQTAVAKLQIQPVMSTSTSSSSSDAKPAMDDVEVSTHADSSSLASASSLVPMVSSSTAIPSSSSSSSSSGARESAAPGSAPAPGPLRSGLGVALAAARTGQQQQQQQQQPPQPPQPSGLSAALAGASSRAVQQTAQPGSFSSRALVSTGVATSSTPSSSSSSTMPSHPPIHTRAPSYTIMSPGGSGAPPASDSAMGGLGMGPRRSPVSSPSASPSPFGAMPSSSSTTPSMPMPMAMPVPMPNVGSTFGSPSASRSMQQQQQQQGIAAHAMSFSYRTSPGSLVGSPLTPCLMARCDPHTPQLGQYPHPQHGFLHGSPANSTFLYNSSTGPSSASSSTSAAVAASGVPHGPSGGAGLGLGLGLAGADAALQQHLMQSGGPQGHVQGHHFSHQSRSIFDQLGFNNSSPNSSPSPSSRAQPSTPNSNTPSGMNLGIANLNPAAFNGSSSSSSGGHFTAADTAATPLSTPMLTALGYAHPGQASSNFGPATPGPALTLQHENITIAHNNPHAFALNGPAHDAGASSTPSNSIVISGSGSGSNSGSSGLAQQLQARQAHSSSSRVPLPGPGTPPRSHFQQQQQQQMSNANSMEDITSPSSSTSTTSSSTHQLTPNNTDSGNIMTSFDSSKTSTTDGSSYSSRGGASYALISFAPHPYDLTLRRLMDAIAEINNVNTKNNNTQFFLQADLKSSQGQGQYGSSLVVITCPHQSDFQMTVEVAPSQQAAGQNVTFKRLGGDEKVYSDITSYIRMAVGSG